MAHNIFGERFWGFRKPAWHNLGYVSDVPMTAMEALEKIDGNFEIVKLPTYVKVKSIFGEQLIETGHFALMREPTDDDLFYRVFGIVSDRFEIIQNRDIAGLLDATLTEKWPVETVGVLGSGETIFFTLQAGEGEVKKDPIKNYFFITDTVDGKHSMKIGFTPVRIVCQNTLITGIQAGNINLDISHFDTVSELTSRLNLLSKLQEAQSKTYEIFNLFAEIILSKEEQAEVFADAYPMPTKPKRLKIFEELVQKGDTLAGVFVDKVAKDNKYYEYMIERNKQLREGASWLMEKWNDEQPSLANTAWGVYNVVVESADFRDGKSNEVDSSALFGSRSVEKERAFKALMEKAL